MHRRLFLSTLASGLLTSAQTPKPKQNIVLILADDLGWRDIGCYGNPNVLTPNIDRLAAEGTRFTNAYAACPVCSPTRASILTGRYPLRTGITDWIPGRQSHPKGPITTPHTAEFLQLKEVTIAELLKPAGYRSASIGKWHLGGDGFLPTDQGFDVNVGGNHRGSPPPSGKLSASYFGPSELPNLTLAAGEFLPERLTDAAVQFIEQSKSGPFFLYLPHYSPHTPLQAREADIARHQQKGGGKYNATYAAMLESVDAGVGRVIDALERTGTLPNTMVVFFSDNGGLRYEGKSKSPVTNNAPLRAGKGHLYEGGVREPFIIRCPGVAKAGSVLDTPVCSIDLLPTFCQLASVPPGRVDGVSLVGLLQGKSLKPRPLYWHYPHYSNQGGEPGSGIREGDWKLIEFHADSRTELFNLKDDPSETRNLAKRNPQIAAKMLAKLKAWRKECGAVMPTRNPNADPNWPGFGLTGEEPHTTTQ